MDNELAYQKLEEAQEKMQEAVDLIRVAMKHMSSDMTRERTRSYILGHLEPLISSEHDWLTRSINLEEIMYEVHMDQEVEDDE